MRNLAVVGECRLHQFVESAAAHEQIVVGFVNPERVAETFTETTVAVAAEELLAVVGGKHKHMPLSTAE